MTKDCEMILSHLRKAQSLVRDSDGMLEYLIAMAIEEAESSADLDYVQEAMTTRDSESASKH
ncbi:MAG: hypothetical protein RIA09_10175 [Hoeflea sp.]|uniref:hypothetical protein n=1 Tax=Hoeflea sp. TaxID=1940281 RepID=UPI0032EC6372